MSRHLRIQRPPVSTGQPTLDGWLNQVGDALNQLPSFSLSSTTNGPNSFISGLPGTLLIDVGSSNTTGWFKRSGTTTLGWSALAFSPLAYGDLPSGSGTWATGSGTTVTFNSSVGVTSQLSVSNLSGVLQATNGLVSAVAGSQYTVTNVTTDRVYDANATTTDELADVLGTLIADLRAAKLIV